MNVELKIDYYKIKILIDGMPHVSIPRKKYLGYQAWTDGTHFSIEYYMKGNTMLTEQDTKDKWLALLRELDKKL